MTVHHQATVAAAATGLIAETRCRGLSGVGGLVALGIALYQKRKERH